MSEYNRYGVISNEIYQDLSKDLSALELRLIEFLENNADNYTRGLLTQTIFDSVMNRTAEFYLIRASTMRKAERKFRSEVTKAQDQIQTLKGNNKCRY